MVRTLLFYFASHGFPPITIRVKSHPFYHCNILLKIITPTCVPRIKLSSRRSPILKVICFYEKLSMFMEIVGSLKAFRFEQFSSEIANAHAEVIPTMVLIWDGKSKNVAHQLMQIGLLWF